MVGRVLDTTSKRVAAGLAVLAVVIGVVAVALAGGGAEASSPTTTTTTAPTTTVPLEVAPLTGVAGTYEGRLARPALFVKIDNAPAARPQAGINQADIVVEERVEGEITRLAAIFHSTDADPLGPVRSTRSTDIDLAALVGRPIYASSGGNDHVLGALRRANVIDVGHNRSGDAFWRQSGRPAPHNLFTTTAGLYQKAGTDLPAAPAPIFTFRAEGAALPSGARPASSVSLSFGGPVISSFAWDEASATWQRSQLGTPHLDASGERVAPANVVVLEIGYSFSGLSKPHGVTTGEGRALVFTAGHVVEGRWVRPGPNSPLQLLAADGSPIALTPGQTFLELPPTGGAQVG